MEARRWPSLLVLATVVGMVVVAVIAVAVHPGALRAPGAWVLPYFLGVVLAAYAAVGVWWLRHPAVGAARGVAFGAVAGLLWFAEIAGGGPLLLGRAAEQVNGTVCTLAAVATTVAAGIWAARRGPAAGAWTCGLSAGLVSGAVVFGLAVPMTLAYLDRLGARPDYQRQFAHSGASGMPAFLVQDALAGYGAHLVLNPALGLVGAGLGVLIARATRGHRDPHAGSTANGGRSRATAGPRP